MLELRPAKGSRDVFVPRAAILTCAYVWGDPRRDKDKDLKESRLR